MQNEDGQYPYFYSDENLAIKIVGGYEVDETRWQELQN